MKVLVIFILTISSISCSNIGNKDKSVSDSTSNKLTGNHTLKQNNLPDFLEISGRSKESFQGYLQGVEKSDSTGPYIIREFIGDTLSFDLIFFPKDLNIAAVDFEAIKKAKVNNYRDYDCFVFEYPMRDPKHRDADFHDDNTPYPVTVKAYVRKGNIWSLIAEQKAKDLTEINQFKIRTMYHNISK